MTAPTMYYEHAIDALKGWTMESALDFSTSLSADVTFAIPAGRCVSLDSDGEFVTGITGTAMAIFLMNGTTSNDLDVQNDGGTQWYAVTPTGALSGFVATGGLEIATTEFDSNQTYAPNDLLTAANADTTEATGGLLTNASVTQFVTPVCGVVSRGVYTNAYGVDVLAFWPVWLPGAAA